MKVLNLFLLFSTFFLINDMHAQQFKVNMGERIKLSGSDVGMVLGQWNDASYNCTMGRREFRLWKCTDGPHNCDLDVFETESKMVINQDIIATRKSIGWVTRTNNSKRKQFEYEVTPIGFNGRFKPTKRIIQLRYKNAKRIPNFFSTFSIDSSKHLMIFEYDWDQRGDYRAYGVVLNEDFEIIWEKDIEIDVSQRKIESSQWKISNKGEIFHLMTEYEHESKKNHKKYKKNSIPAYWVSINRYYHEESESVEIEKGNEFIKTVRMTLDNDSNLWAVYGWGYKDSDPIEGFEWVKYDQGGISSDPSVLNSMEFTWDMVKEYPKRDKLKNSRGTGITDDFEITGMEVNSNGQLIVYGEIEELITTYSTVGMTRVAHHSYQQGSMGVLVIDNDRTIQKFFMIPRYQADDTNYTLTESMILSKDQVDIFYLCGEDSLNEPINGHKGYKRKVSLFGSKLYLMKCEINFAESNISTNRFIVGGYDDFDGLPLCHTISEIEDNKYYVLSSRGSKYCFGEFSEVFEED